MSFFYTKELMFSEFEDATKKDQKSEKETFTHRINYLKEIKDLMTKQPRVFSNLSMTSQQLQNLIDDWSAPKPIDAFYKRIFGVTYAEKLAQEEAEYENYDNEEQTEVKEPKEETLSVD
jgi:hypothetical protein